MLLKHIRISYGDDSNQHHIYNFGNPLTLIATSGNTPHVIHSRVLFETKHASPLFLPILTEQPTIAPASTKRYIVERLPSQESTVAFTIKNKNPRLTHKNISVLYAQVSDDDNKVPTIYNHLQHKHFGTKYRRKIHEYFMSSLSNGYITVAELYCDMLKTIAYTLDCIGKEFIGFGYEIDNYAAYFRETRLCREHKGADNIVNAIVGLYAAAYQLLIHNNSSVLFFEPDLYEKSFANEFITIAMNVLRFIDTHKDSSNQGTLQICVISSQPELLKHYVGVTVNRIYTKDEIDAKVEICRRGLFTPRTYIDTLAFCPEPLERMNHSRKDLPISLIREHTESNCGKLTHLTMPISYLDVEMRNRMFSCDEISGLDDRFLSLYEAYLSWCVIDRHDLK